MIKTKRPTRPSFAGLPCQYRKAILRLRAAMQRKLTPIEIAARNASITPQAALDELKLVELTSLESIVRGHASWIDVQKMADACNIGMTLCHDFGIGQAETLLALRAGEASIIRCAARLERTGKIGFTGDELTAVREMLEWCHVQREVIDRKKFKTAMKLTIDRINNNHRVVDLNQACAAINGMPE